MILSPEFAHQKFHVKQLNIGPLAMTTHCVPTHTPIEATIHDANTTRWKVGDIVIHDEDAKRPDMLMIVIGVSKDGIYRTKYAFPLMQPKAWRRKIWRNVIQRLHDPRRFGICIASNPTMR